MTKHSMYAFFQKKITAHLIAITTKYSNTIELSNESLKNIWAQTNGNVTSGIHVLQNEPTQQIHPTDSDQKLPYENTLINDIL